MALNSSGPISLAGTTAGQSIELELGGNGTTQISLNDAAVRGLAGVASGAITMPTNFWGKSNYYTINNSVRIRQNASAYLSRSIGTTTNQRTWTWSGWVKLGLIPTGEWGLFGAGSGGFTQLQFWGSGATLAVRQYNGSVDTFQLITTQVFKDPGAWYHIVVAMDTTQATSSNRIKLYINGSQVTAFGTASYPSLNETTYVNTSGLQMQMGRRAAGDNYWDGYFAEVNFVDGQALTPSSFGATNSATGVWQPAQYTGTYGTNGFYQKYSDIATTTASNAGLGKDFSGNGNYFVTNNISVTAGVTYDAMTDVPTWTSTSVSNYPTMNPLKRFSSNANFSWGNLRVGDSSASNSNAISNFSFGTSGQYYFEATATDAFASASGIGVIDKSQVYGNGTYGMAGGYRSNGFIYNFASTLQTSGASYTSGDIIGVAVNVSSGTVQFYKNNVAQGATPSYTFTAGTEVWVTAGFDNQNGAKTFDLNFGQRPFAYTPPTGFSRLNTYNIPTPTIGASSTTLANKYFDVSLYTGNTTTVTATNGGFQPDLVWIKDRSQVAQHVLTDAVRGASSQLFSSLTNAEQTNSTYVTSFNSNGFTVGVGNSGTGVVNNNGDSFVGWQWKGANGTVSNTSGSITSTVSANTTSGFSVVTYTGNNTTASIGHGLGATPGFIIVKSRSNASAWVCYQSTLGAGKVMVLSGTNGVQSLGGYWDSAPTSTVVNVGANNDVNGSGLTYVMYCFAPVAGFSRIDYYLGNGSSDGQFVYTGFRPKYIMIKRTDTTANWIIQDTSRSTYNQTAASLYPNLSNAEDTSYPIDILANGFKLRDSAAGYNASGGNFIYIAFAENPLNYSLAR